MVAACGSSSVLAADPPPRFPRHTLGNTELRALPRSSNGRDYLLYVALPYSYASEPARRYPVLYICDGYWDFTLLNGFYGNLRYDRVIPALMIVGLGYQGDAPDYETLRRYDYTPVPDPVEDPKGLQSGHAAEFLRVLETEMIPFVAREYRVDPRFRALGGSSLGGLFALYALYSRPGLFQAYIAPSPATGWANDWLFDLERKFAASGQALDARLFMSGAGRNGPTSWRASGASTSASSGVPTKGSPISGAWWTASDTRARRRKATTAVCGSPSRRSRLWNDRDGLKTAARTRGRVQSSGRSPASHHFANARRTPE
jgi:predicted alpha/beta superfamily hydrolase